MQGINLGGTQGEATAEQVLETLLGKLLRLFNCPRAAVLLLSGSGEDLEVVASKGFKEYLLPGNLINIRVTPFNIIAQELKPIIIDDIRADGRTKDLQWDKATTSILWAPILIGPELGGALALHHDKPNAFTDADLAPLSLLLQQLSGIVRLTRLFRRLQELAIIDSTTGLYNRQHYQRQLQEEVARAQRYQRPVSLLAIDLDDFSKFNAQHGTTAGNKLLEEFSGILKKATRGIDLVARYGPEEFVVLLRETAKPGATIAGERLRAKTEEALFENIKGERSAKITISIGVAAFPEDAKEPQELTERAFAALQKAKAAGKNMVYIAD